jgi:DNA-directed RNA polymerase specialized sigma24 family protein
MATDRLLSFFGDSRESARERYRSHVEHELTVLTELAELGVSLFLGSDRFAAESTRSLGPIEEIPRSHWQPVRPSLDELVPRLENAAIASAYLEHGYSMREIADYLGVHYATVSRRLRRHAAQMSECKT